MFYAVNAAGAEAGVRLMLTMGLAFLISFVAVALISKMIMKDLDAGPGFLALGLLFGGMILVIRAPSAVPMGIFTLAVVSILAIGPYANSRLAEWELRRAQFDKVERAHFVLSAKPENVPTYFALAESLYDIGLPGQAIALAEKTLDGLSQELDINTNQSMRGYFRREEEMVKVWKRRLAGREADARKPLNCSHCGYANPPGNLACGRCNSAYLLAAVRKAEVKDAIFNKVVIAAALTVSLFALIGHVAFSWRGVVLWLTIFGGMAIYGTALGLLFRPPKIR